jgi:hypothetical protein
MLRLAGDLRDPIGRMDGGGEGCWSVAGLLWFVTLWDTDSIPLWDHAASENFCYFKDCHHDVPFPACRKLRAIDS